eukprot:CAMPEP_0181328398 /NCGR_PEP_ID=MMETSP1101-20121128/22687_1 /TAXON_ID=46948 /ORGANISM="Rhodomonas abbreviata, Strain Caron Lab Isolate" /LENGTH=371 /DNA_ID=CAMNT_0023437269 /DNA_START=53 /DNA_END=1168 /DNA_ORIENTATION=+
MTFSSYNVQKSVVLTEATLIMAFVAISFLPGACASMDASSAPSAAPTTFGDESLPPSAGCMEWVLGYSRDSCDLTCSRVGRACNAEHFDDIITEQAFSSMVADANYLRSDFDDTAMELCSMGINTYNFAGAPALFSYNVELKTGNSMWTYCNYPTSLAAVTGDCGTKYSYPPSQRFCPCSLGNCVSRKLDANEEEEDEKKKAESLLIAGTSNVAPTEDDDDDDAVMEVNALPRECPTSYIAHGGHCYRKSMSIATFSAAEAVCVGEGGHLATIQDASENAWVASTFANNGPFYIGNHTPEGGEDCAVMARNNRGRAPGLLNDVPCGHSGPYLCKIEGGNTGSTGISHRPSSSSELVTAHPPTPSLRGGAVY